jgi:hypothetical protein
LDNADGTKVIRSQAEQAKKNAAFNTAAIVGSVVTTVGSGVSTALNAIAQKALADIHEGVNSCQEAIDAFFNEHPEY